MSLAIYDPPITPGSGGGVCTNVQNEIFKQNRIISITSSFIKLVTLPEPTHSPTHSPIHPPIGGGASINHKSSNRIELSRLSTDLFDI